MNSQRPRWKTAVAVVALLCAATMATAGGLMLWQHQKLVQDERNRAEFAAAARQVVVTLMSIDFDNPEDSVRRIIDNSTDPFRTEFEAAAEDFVKVSKDAKVTTTATANAVAVDSATADTAVVLVTASSTVTDAAGAREEPRNWRLSVDLRRDGDQIKLSKVEFIP
jgi:Mce-associated membrane protein